MLYQLQLDAEPPRVAVDGREFKLVGDRAQYLAYLEDVKFRTRVLQGLLMAREAFETGRADYAAGDERYAQLLRAGDAARDVAHAAVRRLDDFFEPAGVLDAFGKNDEARRKFIDETARYFEAPEIKAPGAPVSELPPMPLAEPPPAA